MPRGKDEGEEGASPPRVRPPALRARSLIEVLVRHDVRFIVIGGVAERLLGSPRLTDDFDICAAEDRENKERLAGALNDLEAVFRPPGVEEGYPPPEPWSAKSFSSFTSLALTTTNGWLDVWFRPDGTNGYRDLIRGAVEMEVAGSKVKVAGLDDIIRSKEAAATTKYLSHLPLLRELREQRRRLEGES